MATLVKNKSQTLTALTTLSDRAGGSTRKKLTDRQSGTQPPLAYALALKKLI